MPELWNFFKAITGQKMRYTPPTVAGEAHREPRELWHGIIQSDECITDTTRTSKALNIFKEHLQAMQHSSSDWRTGVAYFRRISGEQVHRIFEKVRQATQTGAQSFPRPKLAESVAQINAIE